jgi:phage baseplate assembly protein W
MNTTAKEETMNTTEVLDYQWEPNVPLNNHTVRLYSHGENLFEVVWENVNDGNIHSAGIFEEHKAWGVAHAIYLAFMEYN